MKKHIAIILLVLVAAAVMLPSLDRPAFWQDEAESALLARSILHDGIPMAWNGTNIITQLSGNDSNANGVWSFTPWLPFYVIAGSFGVLGETNFAGRVPFVIFGLLGLVALYFLMFRLTGSKYVSVLSSVLLFANFQFIFYSRQCKYYSILFLVPPILIYAYCKLFQPAVILSEAKDPLSIGDPSLALRMTKSFRMTNVIFILALIVLFYTNYVSLFTAVIGLAMYQLVQKRGAKFFLLSIIAALLCIPFFFVGNFGVSSSLISGLPSVAVYFEKLGRHIWYFNNMVFGMILIVPLVILWRKKYFNEAEKNILKFFLWIIIPAWLVLPLLNQDVFRYNLHLLPLFAAVTALLVVAFFRWSKMAGVVFLSLILFTNIFSNLPYVAADVFARGVLGRGLPDYGLRIDDGGVVRTLTHAILKPEFAAYYNELTTNYPDAISSVVDYLRSNAKKGDVVYANFDMLSLMFYLPELRYAYQVDAATLKVPKNFDLPSYITGTSGVSWYFYHASKMNLGPYINGDKFLDMQRNQKRVVDSNDLGVSSLYFDINWPQRFYQYINKMLWRDTTGYWDVIVYSIGR